RREKPIVRIWKSFEFGQVVRIWSLEFGRVARIWPLEFGRSNWPSRQVVRIWPSRLNLAKSRLRIWLSRIWPSQSNLAAKFEAKFEQIRSQIRATWPKFEPWPNFQKSFVSLHSSVSWRGNAHEFLSPPSSS